MAPSKNWVPKESGEEKTGKAKGKGKEKSPDKGKSKGKGKAEKGEGKGDTQARSKAAPKRAGDPKTRKDGKFSADPKKALKAMGDGKDEDDRTKTSKTISWILRRGVKVDPPAIPVNKVTKETAKDGTVIDAYWVKYDDLLNCEIEPLKGIEDAALQQVIKESNEEKKRYVETVESGVKLIRALEKGEKESKKDKAGADRKDRSPAKPINLVEATTPKASDGPSKALNAKAPDFVPSAQTSAQVTAAQAVKAPEADWQTAAGGYSGYGNPVVAQYMQMQMYQAMMYQQAAMQMQQQGNHRFSGRIKSYNAEEGYGFIECPQAHQIHGRDVFLHKAHIGTHIVGDWVSFTIAQNSKPGKPQARDLQKCDPVPSMVKRGNAKNKKDNKKADGDKKKKQDISGEGGEEKAEEKAEGAEAPADKPAEAAA